MRRFGRELTYEELADGMDAVHRRIRDTMGFWKYRAMERLRDSLLHNGVQVAIRQSLPGYPRGLL